MALGRGRLGCTDGEQSSAYIFLNRTSQNTVGRFYASKTPLIGLAFGLDGRNSGLVVQVRKFVTDLVPV